VFEPPPQDHDDTGHQVLPQDSADAAQWIRQHAGLHGYRLDAAQENALEHLERLYEDLLALERFDASLIRLLARRRVIRGVYLWGGVGRGKSFLMDSFHICAPASRKLRTHFHHFMQDVHHRLRDLQGQEDPLAQIGRDLAREVRLLCLDEFQVADIGDAMVLRRLLETLFEQGVVLVTTSNVEPDELYRNGLQRSQFLPAIELIRQNLEIVRVDAGIDYRLRALEQAGTYHTPINGATDERLNRAFLTIARHEGEADVPLKIEDRFIRARRQAKGVAWFDFRDLCDGPRAHADYIELARRFHTVLLSNVRRLRPANHDVARRMVWLIDEFYDRRVKLIVSAEAPPTELYGGTAQEEAEFPASRVVAREFDRTVSRLIEMQTHEYLSRPHLG